jgi:hypothetical protein
MDSSTAAMAALMQWKLRSAEYRAKNYRFEKTQTFQKKISMKCAKVDLDAFKADSLARKNCSSTSRAICQKK